MGSDVLPLFKTHTPKERYNEEQMTRQPRVLITSLPRSGSTFLGELFNQNPESGYLYECTRAIGEVLGHDRCRGTPEDQISELVTKLFECDFDPLKQYMESVAKTKGNRQHIYSWAHSEANSSPYKCSASAPNKTMMAIKEITLWAPKLKWLIETIPDFRILWLVRDVRGFVSSYIPFVESDKRENLYYGWGLNQFSFWGWYNDCSIAAPKPEMEALKHWMMDTKEASHKRMAAWWTVDNLLMLSVLADIPKDKWMLVKYEDVSRYPLETAQQIYSFLGKDVVHADVLRWIVASTEGGSDDIRYGTSRDSEQMASAYLNRIPVDKLEEIEKIASPLFDYFGYTRARADKPTNPTVFYRV